ADGGDGEPELAAVELERDALRPGWFAGVRQGDAWLDRGPAGNGDGGGTAEQVGLAEAGDALGRSVPEPNASVSVDEDDAVADRGQYTCRLCALFRLPEEPGVL